MVSRKSIVSHGQAHEAMLQIENALKNAGIAPGETISNLIKMNFFFEKISEEFEINKKLKIFKKTGVLKTTIPSFDTKLKVEEILFNFFEPLFIRERKRNNPDPFFHPEVIRMLQNEIAEQQILPSLSRKIKCSIYRLVEDCSSKKAIEEYMKFGLDKRNLSFISAFSVVYTAIISGELDDKGSCMEVAFKQHNTKSLYYFWINRTSSGLIQIFACEKDEHYFKGISNNLITGTGFIF
jgi:hypothetical protein